jgi:hypothetical protein
MVPTLSQTAPILEFLHENLKAMAQLPEFADLKEAIEAGIANLDKWYWVVDKCDTVVIVMREFFLIVAPNSNSNSYQSLRPQRQRRLHIFVGAFLSGRCTLPSTKSG